MVKTRNTRRNPDFDQACGKVLREVRYFSNLTQAEMAEITGISQAQWSSYEKGKSRLNLDALIIISEAVYLNPMVPVAMIIDRDRFQDPIYWLSLEDYKTIFESVEEYRKEKAKIKLEQLKKVLLGYL